MNIYGRKIIIDRKMGKILCESEIVKIKNTIGY